MNLKSAFAAAIATLTFSVSLHAQEIVKKEPAVGNFRRGQYVLVDNGKCPKGQLLMVSPGALGAGGGGKGGQVARERKCVPH